MSNNLPLDKKFRPGIFEDFVGSSNQSTIKSLQSLIKKGLDCFTILFFGPSGCGKTTLARIVAQDLGARDIDTKELNIGNTRGIEAARAIIDNVRHKSLGGKCKVFILDECHRATRDFWESLLKILEHPPRNTFFILCSTEPQKLIGTIITRDHRFKVNLLLQEEIKDLLKKVYRSEKKRVSKEVVFEIVNQSDGCPRVALIMLDAIIDMEDKKDQIEVVKNFVINENSAEVKDLCQALLKSFTWSKISVLLKEVNEEPESIRRAVLGYMGAVLINSRNDRADEIIEAFWDNYYDVGKAGLTHSCYMLTKK